MEDFVDLLDVQPLLWVPLPAAQHDIVYLFGTDTGPLQDTTLCNALNDLQERRARELHSKASLGLVPPAQQNSASLLMVLVPSRESPSTGCRSTYFDVGLYSGSRGRSRWAGGARCCSLNATSWARLKLTLTHPFPFYFLLL